ncbi:MAG TPA: hypothetical protein VFR90_01045 [Methylibium sp.]|uniref:hypothetical protein n=1 Tax=Methylibium sp. TaxID=2067992 RepID=UPI002DBDC7CC|nr:hypothetical protein [Methylibium sp.]HEU4457692.1 hypothetical protein [Methylibium sp.]
MDAALASLSAADFVDAVIAITLLECVALALWSRRRGGVDLAALAPSLVSGLLLMLALRAAVAGAAAAWIALPVALAGLAHLWDLRRRWPREAQRAAAQPIR